MSSPPKILDVVSLRGTIVESLDGGWVVEFTDDQGRGVLLTIPDAHFESSRVVAEDEA